MEVHAPAKVNLFLEVLGKRPDGYHDIETWMVAVSLFDRMEIEPSDETRVDCDHPDVPSGTDNIVYRAIDALRRAADVDRHVRITLNKSIPPGTGLGGGSSDAAHLLLALTRLWDLSPSREELLEIGARIGSDVNFFLTGPSAICRGRGEVTEPSPLDERLHVLLLIPEIRCRTPDIYNNVSKFLNSSPKHVNLIRKKLGRNWDDRILFNRLQRAAFDTYPALEELHRHLRDIASLTPVVTGSGSALFLADPDPDNIRTEADRLSSRPAPVPFEMQIVHALSDAWDPFEMA